MKLKIFVPFIVLFSVNTSSAQNLKSQFDLANNLFKENHFFDAITEYKRLIFFDSAKYYLADAYYKIGECYKAGTKFDDAIKYFSLAEINSIDVQKIFDCKIQIIRNNILRRTTDRALQLCEKTFNDERFNIKRDTVNYWRGWAYIFADDFESAALHFAKINHNHELKILCEQTDNAKLSVTFAKVISYILPGSGSIYSGNFFSGLLSLTWNVFAGYLTINSFLQNRIFDGFVSGELLWLRFYRGSIQNAEKFTIEKNLDISNKALRYLQNEYKGIKP
jgi:tetratricopeptide (TPR) repeat protein